MVDSACFPSDGDLAYAPAHLRAFCRAIMGDNTVHRMAEALMTIEEPTPEERTVDEASINTYIVNSPQPVRYTISQGTLTDDPSMGEVQADEPPMGEANANDRSMGEAPVEAGDIVPNGDSGPRS